MFTGLIEAVCTIRSVTTRAGGMLLTLDLGGIADDCKIGDSIAVNGVCLTIAGINPAINGGAKHIAEFEISSETLAKTTLGRLKPGSQVNIERAIKAADRFGGHFVLGHIDGTAAIKTIDRRGEFADIMLTANAELLRAMIPKGSVAVDGISLTIAKLDKDGFSVAIIPQTFRQTTLGSVKPGDLVNIETDMIIKAVKKYLEQLLPGKENLTIERLRQLGF
jgi:riboflavin synthase